MELTARGRRVLGVAAALLAVITALAVGQVLRIGRWNALMASPAAATAPAHAPPAVRLAQARALAAGGQFWAALTLYRQIANEAPALRTAARFNEGNLLLREAITLHAAGDDARSQPLLQLAKVAYRQVLRAQPMDFDAKNNLELALRWSPEVEEEQQDPSKPVLMPHSPEVQRGVVQGLP